MPVPAGTTVSGPHVAITDGALINNGAVGYKTATYLTRQLLKRAQEIMVFERFGSTYPVPMNSNRTASWRRYESLAPQTTALTEGLPPANSSLKYTDYKATLQQYGGLLQLTDVVADTHEDPVLQVMTDLAAEQAADTVEYLRYSALRSGTNVIYCGGTSRTTVKAMTGTDGLNTLRLAYRTLRKFRAPLISKIVSATALVGTEPVGACYFAVCHTDVEADLRGIAGFVPIEKYSSAMSALPGEIGKVENFRFITTTYAEPFIGAGSTTTTGFLANEGDTTDANDNVSVYPILVFGRDAYGIVPLQGRSVAKVSAMSPGVISKSDPLGQIGFVSWKVWNCTKILNDTFMLRIECSVSNLGDATMYGDYYSRGAAVLTAGARAK